MERAPGAMRFSPGLQSRAMAGPDTRACVVVIDDDPTFLQSLGRLLRSVGLQHQLFGSIADFVGSEPPDVPTCLVLDVRLPGRSGLDFQRDLAEAGVRLPIVFITGHGDIPMTVQAMKAGAVDFLTKPFRDQTLLDAVMAGIERDKSQRLEARTVKQYLERLKTLSPREREVLREVAQGRLNKQIAFDLGISEITVKLHRSNVMKKMQVSSIGQLIRARVRGHDLAARIGGEELAILMPETNLRGAATVAEELRQAIEHFTFEFAERHLHITVSIGCAQYSAIDEDSANFMRRCDGQLYAAKAAGRNRVCF